MEQTYQRKVSTRIAGFVKISRPPTFYTESWRSKFSDDTPFWTGHLWNLGLRRSAETEIILYKPDANVALQAGSANQQAITRTSWG